MNLKEGIDRAISLLGEHKIYGKECVSECPFCNSDKHKFYLNVETGLYSCKRASCGAHGHINTLLEKLNVSERVKDIVELKRDDKPKVINVENKVRQLEEDDDIVAYMIGRGISYETLIESGCMKRGQALSFITKKGDDIVGVSYRTADKQIWQESGSQQYLWNRSNLDKSNSRIYITEGRVDALTLIEMGYKNVVSMPNGASGHEWIDKEWKLLNEFPEIVLLYDNDKAGKQGFEEAKRRMDFASIFTINLGKYKDVNEAYMEDSNFLYEAMESAKEIQLDGFVSLDGVTTSEGVGTELYSCGIPQFDTIFGGVRMGESSLIVSASGVGKSTVLCNMIKGIISQNEKCGVFSGELTNANLKAWIYSVVGGNQAVNLTPHPFRKGEYLTSINPEKEKEIDKKIKGKLWIYDGGKSDAYLMLKNFSALNKRFGVKYFFIDNLSILNMQTSKLDQWGSEDHFAKVLAEFCRTHKCHVFLFAHPTKSNMNTDAEFIDKNGRVKPISRYDQYSVRGSATLVNLSHNIMFLMRVKNWERQYFIQQMRDVYESAKKTTEFQNDVLPLLKNDLSLFAYLAKNRGCGKTFEDAFFGYDNNTRRIYGLLTKNEDLSREVDVEEEEMLDDEELSISFEEV